jgi:hypothetical protein
MAAFVEIATIWWDRFFSQRQLSLHHFAISETAANTSLWRLNMKMTVELGINGLWAPVTLHLMQAKRCGNIVSRHAWITLVTCLFAGRWLQYG